MVDSSADADAGPADLPWQCVDAWATGGNAELVWVDPAAILAAGIDRWKPGRG